MVKVVNQEVEEIKKLITEGNFILGTDVTLDELKKGKIAKVYVSANASPTVVEDIEHYAPMSGAEIIKLNVPNDELGTICKKPFSVSILSVPK